MLEEKSELVASHGELTDLGRDELLAKREEYKEQWRHLKVELLTLENKLKLLAINYENSVASLPARLKQFRLKVVDLPIFGKSAQVYQLEDGIVESNIERLDSKKRKLVRDEIAKVLQAVEAEKAELPHKLEILRQKFEEQKELFLQRERELNELEKLINEIDKVTRPNAHERPFNR